MPKTNLIRLYDYNVSYDDTDRTVRLHWQDRIEDQERLSNTECDEHGDGEIVFHIPDTGSDTSEEQFVATSYTESGCHLYVDSDLQRIVDVIRRADDEHNFAIVQKLSEDESHHVASGFVRDLASATAWRKTVFYEPLGIEKQLFWLVSEAEQHLSELESDGYQRMPLNTSNHDRA